MPAPQDSGAERALRHVEARSTGVPFDRALRVTLNFHPERVVAALADTGRYVSQFVTGTSNGGLTAFAGGDRWRWESRMFGGAYDEAFADERPVYGGLNFRLHVDELRRHPDYQGPRYVELGVEIAVDGVLTPKIIGDARDRYDPQDVKKVWHLLARFGRP